jgi:hemerythrin-like metal-binding protein
MPIAPWSELLELGIDFIDDQHKELFESLNRLADSIQDGVWNQHVEEQLACIAQRTIKHCQIEETLMKDTGYPNRSRHADQHNELIRHIRSVQYLRVKGQPVTPDIIEFLSEWFGQHIKEFDAGYAGHVRAMAPTN